METMKLNTYKIRPNQTYHEITIREDWKKLKNHRYYEYRELWSELPEKQIISKFPIHMDIEITTLCNLLCPMCPRTMMITQNNFSNSGIMKFEDFRNIIDQCVVHGLYSIKLNYLGEPLVHPNIVEFVKYAKDKGIADVMFNTNGALLTDKLSSGLLNAGLDKLFLSFDSPYKGQYEKIRIGAQFENVLRNMNNFFRLKMEKYPHVHARVSMVMMSGDPEIRRDFIKLFHDTVDAIGFDEYRDTDDRGVKPVIRGFACAQLYQRMFLRLNGNVSVCCGDTRGEYIVGNWKTESLKDIWHGERYTAIRRAHKNGHYHSIPMCSVCTVPLAQERALERKSIAGEHYQ
ncbi:MAG: SPASM domain-containing protein [Candidatus Brocadia sp.]|nr:SPASM domain-containing protein [Candidatus Brocadia sp.]